ncbi:MAG: NifU family protein [Pseudobdellovibrionaceae bacterium]
MFIETEKTPNPETLKFLPGQALLEKGTAEFSDPEQAERYSPLADRLFAVAGVKNIFIGRDFVSITKDETWDWNVLKPMLLTALMQHLTFNEPIVLESYFTKKPQTETSGEDNEIVVQIKALLDERVRPAVAQDGGDIEFDSFEDGILYLRMRGACAGCPSSTLTLKSGIENMMKHYIPEVAAVEAVTL